MLCTEIKEKGKYDMKKVLKRLTGIVLSAAIALGAFTVNTYEVRAAEVIDGNQEYRIKISDGKEQSFTFSTPSDAMTIVETAVEGRNQYSPLKAVLTVDYRNYYSDSIYPGDGKRYSAWFVFKPGQTATLTYSPFFNDEELDVVFKVYFKDPGNLEKESNNYASNATKIKLNKTYNGAVCDTDSDVDWYVFKAPSTGKYKFSAVNTQTSGYSFAKVEGFKSKTKKDDRFEATLSAGSGWAKSKTIKLKKGKKYYIKFSNASYGDNIPVQLRVKKVK